MLKVRKKFLDCCAWMCSKIMIKNKSSDVCDTFVADISIFFFSDFKQPFICSHSIYSEIEFPKNKISFKVTIYIKRFVKLNTTSQASSLIRLNTNKTLPMISFRNSLQGCSIKEAVLKNFSKRNACVGICF